MSGRTPAGTTGANTAHGPWVSSGRAPDMYNAPPCLKCGDAARPRRPRRSDACPESLPAEMSGFSLETAYTCLTEHGGRWQAITHVHPRRTWTTCAAGGCGEGRREAGGGDGRQRLCAPPRAQLASENDAISICADGAAGGGYCTSAQRRAAAGSGTRKPHSAGTRGRRVGGRHRPACHRGSMRGLGSTSCTARWGTAIPNRMFPCCASRMHRNGNGVLDTVDAHGRMKACPCSESVRGTVLRASDRGARAVHTDLASGLAATSSELPPPPVVLRVHVRGVSVRRKRMVCAASRRSAHHRATTVDASRGGHRRRTSPLARRRATCDVRRARSCVQYAVRDACAWGPDSADTDGRTQTGRQRRRQRLRARRDPNSDLPPGVHRAGRRRRGGGPCTSCEP